MRSLTVLVHYNFNNKIVKLKYCKNGNKGFISCSPAYYTSNSNLINNKRVKYFFAELDFQQKRFLNGFKKEQMFRYGMLYFYMF